MTLLAGPAQADATHATTYTIKNLGTLGGLLSIPLGVSGHTVIGYSSRPGER
jgi:hypothetical protein